MTYQLLTALVSFAFVTSVTPGPNNLMLMASGANFGFRRTVPHMLGVSIGFVLMAFLIGFGLARIFVVYPVAHTVLKAASLAYMVYLASKIARASAPTEAVTGTSRAAPRPFSFIEAALFQWVNPKAWAMALTAVTVYSPENSVASLFVVAAVFGIINLPTISSWILLGQQMRHFLTNPRRARLFNFTMAGLLLASVVPILID